MNVHTELPIGSKSQGYDRATIEEADIVFELMVATIRNWKDYTVDVVMTDDQGKEIRRTRVEDGRLFIC